jgi:hypothetical protein
LQGAGRHDNPEHYGCLYVSEQPVSTVAEALAPFRGTGALSDAMLVRAGRPLALAELALADDLQLIDLDDPRTLTSVRLHPSQVATSTRVVTQAYAKSLFDRHPAAVALRWWSTLESALINLTLHGRASSHLRVTSVEPLTLDHRAVGEAAELLGLVIDLGST